MTHQQAHRHADPSRATAGHADDLGPGRESRSAKLDAPMHPIESGLIQRKARDSNGVAEGADAAVASASSSSGHALPETLMRKFEGSLGADLSGVRVHTGAESAHAADAVGARAYTLGQDILFGAGQYDPSSPAGEHLLAHEVAHTVQQRGGTPTRQNKLEVSAPADTAEHEADRAADAMTAGAPFAIGGRSATAARDVLRKPEWGAGFKPTLGNGVAKLAVEGSAKWKAKLGYGEAAFQGSITGEAEVKWKPDAAGGVSTKTGTGSGGKESAQFEADIPLWKEEAHKAAEREADHSWMDYFEPVESDLVFGADVSAKPGDAGKTETKGAIPLAIKCKTRSGDSWTVKLQFFELSRKGDVLKVEGPGLKLGYDKKLKASPISVSVGETTGKLTFAGSLKGEVSFQPNWEEIGKKAAERTAEQMSTESVMAAAEAASIAGPPLLVAAITAASIYTAGERGELDASILTGAKDAKRAAYAAAMLMSGWDNTETAGPIGAQLMQQTRAELAKQAAKQNVTLEALLLALQKQRTKHDFAVLHEQLLLQARGAYEAQARAAVDRWRSHHRFASFWTRAEDDMVAADRLVAIAFEHHTGL